MAETVVTPLRLFHVVAIAGSKSTIPVVIRTDRAGAHTIERLHAFAARRGGFVTTVYATGTAAARRSVRTHADTAYATLHGRHATLAKDTAERAVVFRKTSFDTTGDLDVVTVTREPACMYAGRVWTDYLSSLGYDRYAISAPSDGAALCTARELFLDELYASFTA
ncbi:hypothetical protein [Streptomyces sp. 11x1]|uniref:hypothetical protein n=1 Tax=Streptomyces sp. 11x1 TaxID=3038642 RepID=UPI00292E49F6|nr:hypothetical protein [Streptomyces sp. 11x1]WNZ14895.1 hypothetical protein P8T65_46515 [Streptomyces sp. 11x1]